MEIGYTFITVGHDPWFGIPCALLKKDIISLIGKNKVGVEYIFATFPPCYYGME